MTGPTSYPAVSALLVGAFSGERKLVRDIFRKHGWQLLEAADRTRALDSIRRNDVQVVVTECDLPGWNWRDLLQDLQSLTQPPELVVASRTADDYLWAEVLNIGACDVLAQPLEPLEVERVVAAASRQFQNPQRHKKHLTAGFPYA